MLKKLMLVVASLWVVLYSSNVNAHYFVEKIQKLKKSVCLIETVVGTTVIDSTGPKIEKNPFEEFFDKPELKKQQEYTSGTGSCFIIKILNEKYIITNNHVVSGQANQSHIIYVYFYDNLKQYEAKVVGTDKLSDIAVLKMKTPEGSDLLNKIKALEFGNSDNTDQGEPVFAIGHPVGQEWTVTQGIISAVKKRTSNTWQEVIQTDVSINPGNSGGPLFNQNGKVIGINSFIMSSGRAGSIGINFSVTSNSADSIIKKIIKYGKISRGRIGIAMSVDKSNGTVIVKQIQPGGPMDKAGFKAGDILEKINNHIINNITDVGKALDGVEPNQKIDILVLRGQENILQAIVTDELKTE